MQYRVFQFVATSATVAVMVLPAAAQVNLGAHLTHGPAILDYTPNGTGAFPATSNGAAGNVPMNFQVHGAWNDPAERQVFSGNWFYRVQGDNRDRHLINPGTRTPTGTHQTDWTFPQVLTGGTSPAPVAGLSTEMGFQLQSTGPDSAYFYTYLCFHNTGSAPVNVSVFFAADIDLNGTFGGDVYSPLVTSSAGLTWNLTDGAATGIMFGPGADAAGVGSVAAILGALTNSTPTSFLGNLNASGLGAGDHAAVMQYERTIFPGQSVCCAVYLGIGVNGVHPIVPSPAAAPAMLALSLLTVKRRRR